MSVVTQFDRYYATRVMYLLLMPFTQQKAFSLGIIDKNGNKVKEPVKEEEKRYYTELHQVCFEVKKLLNKIPSSEMRLKIAAMSLQILRRKNIPSMFLDGIVMEQKAKEMIDSGISLIVEETFIKSILKELPLFEEEGGVVNSVTGIAPTNEPVIDPKKKPKIVKRELNEEAQPIYVSRKLLNAQEVFDWFKGQGFDEVLTPDEMHVTVCYSRDSVDSGKLNLDDQKLNVSTEGRTVDPLGDKGAVVLKFNSSVLQDRWKYFREKGASWDYESYQPHVTVTYKKPEVDLEKVKPFEGRLEFGPEILEPLDLYWSDEVDHK